MICSNTPGKVSNRQLTIRSLSDWFKTYRTTGSRTRTRSRIRTERRQIHIWRSLLHQIHAFSTPHSNEVTPLTPGGQRCVGTREKEKSRRQAAKTNKLKKSKVEHFLEITEISIITPARPKRPALLGSSWNALEKLLESS